MIKHILKELPVYWQKSKPIAKRYHVPTAFIFADRLWSRAVYGALSSDVSEDYNTFTFYRLSSLARRDLYTSGRYRTSCKWFFPDDLLPVIDAKKGFDRNFAEYLKRDVLFLPCSEGDLMDFPAKHGVTD